MTTQRKQQQELFPDLPRDPNMVDDNGKMKPLWSLGISNVFQALQKNFKREGIMLPPLTTSQITDIENLYAPYIGQPYEDMLKVLPDITGQTIVDITVRVPKVFIITVDGSGNVLTAAWKTYVLV